MYRRRFQRQTHSGLRSSLGKGTVAVRPPGQPPVGGHRQPARYCHRFEGQSLRGGVAGRTAGPAIQAGERRESQPQLADRVHGELQIRGHVQQPNGDLAPTPPADVEAREIIMISTRSARLFHHPRRHTDGRPRATGATGCNQGPSSACPCRRSAGPFVFDTAEQHKIRVSVVPRGCRTHGASPFFRMAACWSPSGPAGSASIRNGVLDPTPIAGVPRCRTDGYRRPDGRRAASAVRREPAASTSPTPSPSGTAWARRRSRAGGSTAARSPTSGIFRRRAVEGNRD